MQARLGRIGVAIVAMLMLGACEGDRNPELMNLRSKSRGPDEFGILPTKPLVLPDDFAALPEPIPGGTSRTDPTPEADAIAALGGNAGVLDRARTSDGAILSHATRFGLASDIRSVLAAEDLEFRRKNNGRILERLFNINVYFRAYEPQELDQHAELARWRKLGIRTNAAPPDPEAK